MKNLATKTGLFLLTSSLLFSPVKAQDFTDITDMHSPYNPSNPSNHYIHSDSSNKNYSKQNYYNLKLSKTDKAELLFGIPLIVGIMGYLIYGAFKSKKEEEERWAGKR